MTAKPLDPPERIAIVGSRVPHDGRRATVRKLVGALVTQDAVVVTGDCPTGVDTYVVEICTELGVPYVVHRADWSRHAMAAGPIRNAAIVADCNRMIALPNMTGDSRGTSDAVAQATKAGKRVVLVEVKE